MNRNFEKQLLLSKTLEDKMQEVKEARVRFAAREWREGEERNAGGNHSCLIRMAMAARQRNVQTTVRRGHKYPNRGRGSFPFTGP